MQQSIACAEALRAGGMVVSADEWLMLYVILLCALAVAISKVAGDLIVESGPPDISRRK